MSKVVAYPDVLLLNIFIYLRLDCVRRSSGSATTLVNRVLESIDIKRVLLPPFREGGDVCIKFRIMSIDK